MNLEEVVNILIISMSLGVRFIPIISISDLFGGRYVPALVKSSLVGIIGIFRFFIIPEAQRPFAFDLIFVIKEFFIGYILSLPFILLTKYIISSSSIIENVFGSISTLNTQGIFDERNSSLEMIFEMLVISLMFISNIHILVLGILLSSYNIDISFQNISTIIHNLLIDFNIISRNGIGYFFPVFLISFVVVLVLSISDKLGQSLNISANTTLLNTIIIIGGVALFLNKIVVYIGLDIERLAYLTRQILVLLSESR